MSMRGSARRALVVDVPSFGWDRAAVSVLRHSTLPWYERFTRSISLDATPLASKSDAGARDRLSLTGQYAAHVAFLQFAGVADGEFDPAEWVVVRKRGADCRLVRIGARHHVDEPPPLLTLIQQFAAVVGAPPLDVLRQSWARAEAAYHEIESRLRTDAVADLRWLHAAAMGVILAPTDLDAFRAHAALDDSIVVLGEEASPLVRYSALRSLRVPPLLDERAVVERLAASDFARKTIVMVSAGAFDAASRRVVELLQAARVGVWVEPSAQTKTFLVSPQLQAMPTTATAEWLEEFVQSAAFARYLDEGELPAASQDDAIGALCEPVRSFIAAVSLLGCRTPRALVDRFLEKLMSTARAADLVTAGVCAIEGDIFAFASESVRDQAMRSIPAASRGSLSRVAAEVLESAGNRIRAARLLLDCGVALPERLKQALADSLFAAGRYRDAREFASDLLLARIDRRTGHYRDAFTRLSRISRDFESDLLRAEVLVLLDRRDEAHAALDGCKPETEDQRMRLAYQRGIFAIEAGCNVPDVPHDYFGSRLSVYRSIATNDVAAALPAARKAIAAATIMSERVDATLDLIYALFCTGNWSEARAAALDALVLVDQTQGDRAAGGILFTLAYLAADDGQCTHAAHIVERLRRFYGDARDEKRLAELEMLTAAIEFSRGRFGVAKRAAAAVLQSHVSDQIRETAALIADEIDWIEHRSTPLRSTGSTPNVELTNRHALLRARRGMANLPLHGLASQVFTWENGGPIPDASTGSEKLMLYRAALGRGRGDDADRLAAELHIDRERLTVDTSQDEARMLRAAAVLAFPFEKQDFTPIRWRFASRNRLGQWQEIGSLDPMATTDLDAFLAAPAEDWIACSDRELLYVDGLSAWPAGSREAIASLFRVRAEHYRLHRLVENNPPSATNGSVEGLVGESEAMRDVYEVIARVSKRDVPICILGESGTGKELVARAIHRQSPRRQKPFTPINCAALPENLIESELFGHVRGAFTGADRDRAGLIEMTEGGTLFLDEIGELPLPAQAKLLRFLQEGEFRRVGETAHRSADVRVVAATNRKLEAAVEQARFREDLYYRIRGVEIVLPPLRDRASDVAVLAAHFLATERRKHPSGPAKFSAEALATFGSYHWPGNVRELQNTIRAAHALAGDAREIDLEHLPERIRGIKIVRTPLGSYQDAVARFRRDLIERSLLQANGNQNQAAALLKISRQALAYQIRELGILVKPPKWPQP